MEFSLQLLAFCESGLYRTFVRRRVPIHKIQLPFSKPASVSIVYRHAGAETEKILSPPWYFCSFQLSDDDGKCFLCVLPSGGCVEPLPESVSLRSFLLSLKHTPSSHKFAFTVGFPAFVRRICRGNPKVLPIPKSERCGSDSFPRFVPIPGRPHLPPGRSRAGRGRRR